MPCSLRGESNTAVASNVASSSSPTKSAILYGGPMYSMMVKASRVLEARLSEGQIRVALVVVRVEST